MKNIGKLQVRQEKRNLLCEIKTLDCRSPTGVYVDLMCQMFYAVQLSKGVGIKTTPFKIPTTSHNNKPLKAVS